MVLLDVRHCLSTELILGPAAAAGPLFWLGLTQGVLVAFVVWAHWSLALVTAQVVHNYLLWSCSWPVQARFRLGDFIIHSHQNVGIRPCVFRRDPLVLPWFH